MDHAPDPGLSPPSSPTGNERTRVEELLTALLALREASTTFAEQHAGAIRAIEAAPLRVLHAERSAANLLHYLAIRREDLRPLHVPLAELGLSSLGRIEPHVLSNLDAVIARLASLCERTIEAPTLPAPIALAASGTLLDQRATALLGPRRHTHLSHLTHGSSSGPDRPPTNALAFPRPPANGRIMVTLPTHAAEDPALLARLAAAGMTCARINTAHDDPAIWQRMIEQVRAVAPACRILMDLGGPKLRTGHLEPGPAVIRIKPQRDALGRTVTPGELLLVADDDHAAGRTGVPVAASFLARLDPGQAIELRDARGRHRIATVADRLADGSVRATCDRTLYLVPGTLLRARDASSPVGSLPPIPQPIVVRPGDPLRLSFIHARGRPARDGSPAIVVSTLPSAFGQARAGDRIWFDDGKVGTHVETIEGDGLDLRVDHADPQGSRIAEDKGINIPEMISDLRGLTDDDRAALPIAARHADLVGLSFVRDAADVERLRAELDRVGGGHLGVLLKIETREAFENLPSILLAALASPSAGVMIARGDLAVEIGYERLAEVQEEILWLCEAAHLPVVWATQVLETMAKTGTPSRAEITDAAMAERAECTMLNKGPHIVEAVEFLDRILSRMSDHQSKKRTILRPLAVARRFGR
jgi:pyruvate kinase